MPSAAAGGAAQTITLEPELGLLVSIVYETNLLGDERLPQELLEPQAVASATKIGEGSTFLTCRKKVPPVRDIKYRTLKVEGLEITAQSNQAKNRRLPKYVVYKVAQVEFTKIGRAVPHHRQRLVAAFLETCVLTHGPVRSHPYLPSLLDFAWGPNGFQTDQRIPIPILAFAEYGNLADLQKSRNLTDDEKYEVCWQVGTALDFLHQCDIKHGDVKSENVLVHRTCDDRMQALLSDFGLAVIADEGSLKFLPPGTLLWAAPELRWRSEGATSVLIEKADIFSYGLFVWRVFCEGLDPLSRVCLPHDTATMDELASIGSLEDLLSRPGEGALRQIFERDLLIAKASSFIWKFYLTLIPTLRSVRDTSLQVVISTANDLFSTHRERYRQLTSELQLVNVFETTLSLSAEKRDLTVAVEALSKGRNFQKPAIKPLSITKVKKRRLTAAAFNEHPMSWIAMRGLDPDVMAFIFNNMLERAANEKTPHMRTGLFLGNAVCYLSGMGSDLYVDVDEALKALIVSARYNNTAAAALVYRMHNAFDRDVPDDIDYIFKMQNAAIHGSVAAYEDLQAVAAELAPPVRYSLLHQTCGIGASIFWDDNCMNGWSFADRTKLDWVTNLLQMGNSDLWKVKINKRGDTLLHAASALNFAKLFDILTLERNFPLNVVNGVRETPLLCAMRSGANDIALALLHRGADPCIISHRGESPLHWIMSITEFGYKTMIATLMDKGGLQTLTCWADVCDYSAANIHAFHQYSERLTKGTPLHWAICRKKAYLVQKLLDLGAPTDFRGPNQRPNQAFHTPLQLAAYLHEPNILRLLIEKSKKRQAVLTDVSGMVRAAIDGSDRFSMLLRHGDRYWSRMRETFQILGKEIKSIQLITGVDSFGSTPLRYAVRGGYDEAVEMLFRYMDAEKDVNVTYSHMGWTPLCEAIWRNHRGIFRRLLELGADMNARVDNPSCSGRFDWGLLHLAAQFVICGDLTITKELMLEKHELPIDGYGHPDDPAESPLYTALENDHYEFATFLRKKGADVNARSRYIFSGRVRLSYQTSILGRVVASRLRHSKHRLHYLLYPAPETSKMQQVDFIVIPETGYSALHLSLMDSNEDNLIHPEEKERQEWDQEIKDEIFRLVLEKYDKPEEINLLTAGGDSSNTGQEVSQTALHIAVCNANLAAVKLLVEEYEADVEIKDGKGRLAVELAREMLPYEEKTYDQKRGETSQRSSLDRLVERRREILNVLENNANQ